MKTDFIFSNIFTLFLVVITLFLFIPMSNNIVLNEQTIKINNDVIKKQNDLISILKDTKTRIVNTESTYVYLLDKNNIEKILPFCPLVDDINVSFCWDYSFINGYEGITIINLNNKYEEYDQ